ncbi:MAG: kinase/pyrophosphorylase [Burkholderiales bacterium]|nr:kinase/pyrophosphorylase [Burkholderiales bacterium]
MPSQEIDNKDTPNTEVKPKTRTVFYVSDATAITAETLSNSVLAQFRGLAYSRYRMPFINTLEKAKQAAMRINEKGKETGVRPIVFSTLVASDLASTFNEYCNAFVIELFRAIVGPLERELGIPSDHSVGKSHEIGDQERYNKRIEAINYTLSHDDGQTNRGLEEADVILVGVSRCGKTPTSLYLAMQYGIKAANYPLIPEDFERGELPHALQGIKKKVFGLSIRPERLSVIRNERRPFSEYASIENCRYETREAEMMMNRENIPFLSSTTKSIEEISATILQKLKIKADPHIRL